MLLATKVENLILPAGGEGNLYRVYAYLVYFAKFADERNQLESLSFVHKTGELVASREEIAAFTGLTRSMVSKCVAELVKKGWVETYFIGKLSYFLVCNYAELTGGAQASDKQRKGARGRAPQQQQMPPDGAYQMRRARPSTPKETPSACRARAGRQGIQSTQRMVR